jgi:hypothetical protein
VYFWCKLTLKTNIMKKNYFLAVLFAFGMISANAQFALDDMESYGGGNAPILDAQWGSWDGTAGTAMLSSGTYAQSGALSGWIDGSGIDPLLLFGDKIFGSWGLKFASYIPAGSTGYWNMQGQEAPGIQWVVGNVTFVDNVGTIDYSSADPLDHAVFDYPSDQWFETIINFDFNAGSGASTWTVWVDGVEVVAAGTPYADVAGVFAQALGAVNLYSASATNEMYIDDVEYINDFYPGPLGVADLDAVGFSAYPNPVKNVLNLQANEEISTAVVYNVLGQEVYNVNINALNATIDMASFASGAYFVKVNVGGTEGVVKVLK